MELSFPLLLARRYLRSTRRDAFASFLSAVAAGGIALGVAALVLVLGALAGFQRALKGEVLARTPAIEVELPATTDAAARASLAQRLAALPGVTGVQEVVRGRGWLLAGSRAQPAELVGYAGELPRFFPAPISRAPGLYIGERLATAWGLDPGATLEVVSPRSTLGPLGPQPRSRRLLLVGTFHSGRTEQETRIALPMDAAVALLGDAGRRLVVDTVDLDRALRVAADLPAILPAGAVVRSWQELNRPLFFALALEKTMAFLAVALIVLVAALALVSDLALIIANKRAELGILAAMGATPRMLRRAFLWLGAALGIGGALGGGVVGVAAAWVLDRYQVLPLPGDAYFLQHVPFAVEGRDLLAVLGVTLTLTLLCAAWGADRVTVLDPVEALRR
jgi:lipoprotein-releasing system permease protein